MIDPSILAAVPEAFKAEYLQGNVYRVGMLLFKKGQRGILAHLIETGGTASAVNGLVAANPYLAAGKVALDAAGHIATNVQLHQLKAAVATMQTLQLGTLALSGAGLGFSIISHQMITARLERMEGQAALLNDKLDRMAKKIDELQRDTIQRDFVVLRTACEKADNGWSASNPESEWLSAEASLHGLQNQFATKIDKILLDGSSLDVVEPFVDALALAGATRISCRIAAGDLELARKISVQFAEEFSHLLQPVGSASIVQSQLEARSIKLGSPQYVTEAETLLPSAELKAAAYRDSEEVAATRPATILQLQHLGVSGREFLERARAEGDEPLLALRGDAETELG